MFKFNLQNNISTRCQIVHEFQEINAHFQKGMEILDSQDTEKKPRTFGHFLAQRIEAKKPKS